MSPTEVEALANLARICVARGGEAEARGLLRRAREVDPDNVELMLKLARLQATSADREVRDGSEALRLAQLAAAVALRASAPAAVAASFARTRLGGRSGTNFGAVALDPATMSSLLERALPPR